MKFPCNHKSKINQSCFFLTVHNIKGNDPKKTITELGMPMYLHEVALLTQSRCTNDLLHCKHTNKQLLCANQYATPRREWPNIKNLAPWHLVIIVVQSSYQRWATINSIKTIIYMSVWFSCLNQLTGHWKFYISVTTWIWQFLLKVPQFHIPRPGPAI